MATILVLTALYYIVSRLALIYLVAKNDWHNQHDYTRTHYINAIDVSLLPGAGELVMILVLPELIGDIYTRKFPTTRSINKRVKTLIENLLDFLATSLP